MQVYAAVMSGTQIGIEQLDGGVAIARMDDGENRFNLDSLSRWHEVLTELEQHDGPLALVITGTGKFFSNGLDLDWISANSGEFGRVVEGVHSLFGRLLVFPAYVIAAINGHAFAAGAMLSCTADLRLMRRDRGYWCLPEVDLDMTLTRPMMEVVTARLPSNAIQDAIITGRRYGGEEALARGIVDDVDDEHALVDRAVELAQQMATKNRSVIAAHKMMMFGESARVCGWVPERP